MTDKRVETWSPDAVDAYAPETWRDRLDAASDDDKELALMAALRVNHCFGAGWNYAPYTVEAVKAMADALIRVFGEAKVEEVDDHE